MALPSLGQLTMLLESVERFSANSLQPAKTWLAVGFLARGEQALVGELRQHPEHIERRVNRCADGRCRGRREPARKNRAPTKHRSLRRLEQLVARGNSRTQRAMTCRRVTRRAQRERSASAQPLEDGGRREHAQLRRGQLDRQRQAIQTRANLDHRGQVLSGQAEGRAARPSAIEEQRDCRVGRGLDRI